MEAVRGKYGIRVLDWLEEGEAKGRAKGRAEGKVEIAVNMFRKGFKFSDVQDATGLKTDYLVKLQQSVASETKAAEPDIEDDDDDLSYSRGRR